MEFEPKVRCAETPFDLNSVSLLVSNSLTILKEAITKVAVKASGQMIDSGRNRLAIPISDHSKYSRLICCTPEFVIS